MIITLCYRGGVVSASSYLEGELVRVESSSDVLAKCELLKALVEKAKSFGLVYPVRDFELSRTHTVVIEEGVDD